MQVRAAGGNAEGHISTLCYAGGRGLRGNDGLESCDSQGCGIGCNRSESVGYHAAILIAVVGVNALEFDGSSGLAGPVGPSRFVCFLVLPLVVQILAGSRDAEADVSAAFHAGGLGLTGNDRDCVEIYKGNIVCICIRLRRSFFISVNFESFHNLNCIACTIQMPAERLSFDCGHACRNAHASQAAAVVKCVAANSFYAVCDGHARQIIAVPERITADACYTVRN